MNTATPAPRAATKPPRPAPLTREQRRMRANRIRAWTTLRPFVFSTARPNESEEMLATRRVKELLALRRLRWIEQHYLVDTVFDIFVSLFMDFVFLIMLLMFTVKGDERYRPPTTPRHPVLDILLVSFSAIPVFTIAGREALCIFYAWRAHHYGRQAVYESSLGSVILVRSLGLLVAFLFACITVWMTATIWHLNVMSGVPTFSHFLRWLNRRPFAP